jgi:hypothetical protein
VATAGCRQPAGRNAAPVAHPASVGNREPVGHSASVASASTGPAGLASGYPPAITGSPAVPRPAAHAAPRPGRGNG